MKTGKIFTYDLTIKETFLDVFGHMNNAEYLRLFEEARWEMIEAGGRGLNYIKAHHIGPVLLEVNVKYKRELKHRDQIQIISQSTKLEGRFITIEQKMVRKSDGKIACEAIFIAGLFDLKERKLLDYSEDWLKAVGWPVDS